MEVQQATQHQPPIAPEISQHSRAVTTPLTRSAPTPPQQLAGSLRSSQFAQAGQQLSQPRSNGQPQPLLSMDNEGHPSVAYSTLDEQLSIEVPDEDAEAVHFVDCLEKWSHLMRRAVIADFMDAKASIQRKARRRSEALTSEQNDRIAELTKRVLDLTEERRLLRDTLEKREELLLVIGNGYGRMRETVNITILIARWRTRTAETRRLGAWVKMAEMHRRKVVLRKGLVGFQMACRASWKRAAEKQMKIAAEKTMEEMSAVYEKRIEELRVQLKGVQLELKNSDKARIADQEKYKLAVMRGVSALNMEALSVLNMSHDNGSFVAMAEGNTSMDKEEVPGGAPQRVWEEGGVLGGGQAEKYNGKTIYATRHAP
ncbi:hypothetical protein BJ742DRAFT_812853 [Cladochytrium replicatum]|nr:hypothetical protein BJ742DRAFT_812853 [Cladochytrium replicatum]